MAKEDVVHIFGGIPLSLKENEIMPLAATWLDLEMIILSEVSQTNINMISLPCSILKKRCKSTYL